MGWVLFLIWTIVWVAVLYTVLTREDFDTLSKILWTMVVIFVPAFGIVLYWVAAPSAVLRGGSGNPRESSPGSAPRKSQCSSDVAGTPWENNPGFTQQ